MTPEVATEPDPFAVARAHTAPGLLREFNDIGVLAAADVHVARTLTRLGGEHDETVALAAALAVRAPRLGHVYVDLATIADTATVDADEPVDLSGLPWPEPGGWTRAVAQSALVAVCEDADLARPLRLLGTRLYLDRYWREERQVAGDLRAFYGDPDGAADMAGLHAGLERLFPDETGGRQALAAAAAVLRRFAVIAGGPGTGKTTTVARVVALLAEQAGAAGDAALPLVALAAPTGKAAARLEESVHAEAATLDVDDAVRAHLTALSASTLHRLLGRRPGSNSRFRHHRGNRLPHDVVIVDETSMVSLSLMARLVEAVRSDARLILVGDPGQLTSIEAGAVLGDIVGPAGAGRMRMRAGARDRLAVATGAAVPADDPPGGAGIGDGIVVLDRVHRFGGAIAALADAIRAGDGDALVDGLRSAEEAATWIEVDVGDPSAGSALDPVRAAAVGSARSVIEAARAGDARHAIEALGAFRLLCAHRQGPHGAATWTTRVETWLAEAVRGFGTEGEWYPGRPLLVTENDHGLKLYNGDTGVVVAGEDGRVSAAFERGGQVLEISPTRLAAVDAVYAMTVHKSQGSQFDTAALLLPASTSRILTRELLYTAVTRARERLIVVGTEDTLRAAVARPIARASGLRERVWAASA